MTNKLYLLQCSKKELDLIKNLVSSNRDSSIKLWQKCGMPESSAKGHSSLKEHNYILTKIMKVENT